MVDHSDVQEVFVADKLKEQQVSDLIHEKRFIVIDDLYDLHSERQVRRRRSSPEAFSGKCLTITRYFHIKIFRAP